MLLKKLFCTAAVLCSVSLWSAEYFVDVKGSDKNPGTKTRPFKTLQRAARAAKPGDVVTLRPGLHSGNINIITSGTADKPVVFQGMRGKNGEYLSIIDPGKPVKGWVKAPEIAPGVWKAPLKKRPASVLCGGKSVTYISAVRMNLPRKKSLPPELLGRHFSFDSSRRPYNYSKLIPGFDLLSLPENILVFHKQVDWKLKKKQAFWPAIGNAVCGWKNGYLYFRFANGASPEDKKITAGTGNGFTLKNKSHIIIQDLMIRGVGSSVFISGKDARNNIIRRNHMMHGTTRVSVEKGASNTLIEDNLMTLGFIGARNHGSGTWKENRVIYLTFKFIATGRQTSNDAGVQFRAPGPGNVVRRNLIYQGLVGIRGTEGKMVKIHDNFVREMSSVGIVSGYGSQMEIHDNFIMDCAINLRVHSIRHCKTPRLAYIYRNVLYHSADFGMQFFFHTAKNYPDLAEQIWIYNNTVYKSSDFGNLRSFTRSYGNKKKHPVRILNNLLYVKGCGVGTHCEIFAGNMLNDNGKKTAVSGPFGRNSKARLNAKMFAPLMEGKFPALLPVKNSALCTAGVDLGSPVTVCGKTYPALPGMKKGDRTIGARRSAEQLTFQKKMFQLSEKLRSK